MGMGADCSWRLRPLNTFIPLLDKMSRTSPIAKVFGGWMIIITFGISGFVWARKDVEAKRYQAVKTKKAIKEANLPGTYDPSVYRGTRTVWDTRQAIKNVAYLVAFFFVITTKYQYSVQISICYYCALWMELWKRWHYFTKDESTCESTIGIYANWDSCTAWESLEDIIQWTSLFVIKLASGLTFLYSAQGNLLMYIWGSGQSNINSRIGKLD